jgi:hypothetical protein
MFTELDTNELMNLNGGGWDEFLDGKYKLSNLYEVGIGYYEDAKEFINSQEVKDFTKGFCDGLTNK